MTKSNLVLHDDKGYVPRGIFSDYFMSELKCFDYIIAYANRNDSELDIQVRGDYLNIYHNGGNLMKLQGRQTIVFDENYFYTPDENGLRSTDIDKLCKKNFLNEKSTLLNNKSNEEKILLRKEALEIRRDLVGKRDALVKRLKACRTKEETISIIEEMKAIMDGWKQNLVRNKWRLEVKNERSVQHYISLHNKKFDETTDFIVLDIEYALPAEAKYFDNSGSRRSEHPRLDIVAIDKDGRIYVMELKYGMKSVSNESGAKEHLDDFNRTVGGENWPSFVKDIQILFDYKYNAMLISKDAKIDISKKPIFAFVMKMEYESDMNKFQKHLEDNGMMDVPTIYLPVDSSEKEYPSQNYKLSNFKR